MTREDVKPIHFLVTTPLVLFAAYLLAGLVVGLVRGTVGLGNFALFTALISVVPAWKLTLLFTPSSATTRTQIIACGALSVLIFGAITVTNMVGEIMSDDALPSAERSETRPAAP